MSLHSIRATTIDRLNTRSLIVSITSLLICAVLFLGPVSQLCPVARAETRSARAQTRKQISLPTPRSHYETFKRGTSGLPLLMELMKQFEPEAQKLLLRFALASGIKSTSVNSEAAAADLKKLQTMAEAAGISTQAPLVRETAVALLKKTDWAAHRPIIIEFLVHQSGVMEMIPEKWGEIWIPIIHDAMLNFLDHLSDDRLLDKVVGLAMLPPNTPPGDYLVEFVSKVPSLQKMGQILARNPDLAPEYRRALQGLEAGIRTMNGQEVAQFITSDIGKPQIDKWQMQFADTLAGEASVGATILASGIPPGTTVRRKMICKIVKPYVLVYMPEDLAIIDGLAEYFTVNHDFYNLGTMPLVDIFKEIRKALTNEINIVAEQKNFIRAREYYRGSKKVVVPEIFPISTSHVTVMEFMQGEKITSAFKGDQRQRSIMAARLSEVMTGDVIFSKKPDAIFHGDPHPGNVYHFTGDPANPYKIALIDWGLMGVFPRADRMALMQLLLGAQMSDPKRLRKNVGGLVEGGLPNDPAKLQKVDALIAEAVRPKPGHGSFDVLGDLLAGLIEQGYTTKFDLNIFIKSQATIAGELIELDPNLKQDDLVNKQVTGLVKSELFPKRLFCFVFCYNSHGYRSLLSNADIMAARKIPSKPKESKAPASQPVSSSQPQPQR
ncbi:MAG: AarF/UbiB family protein [Pyrinomonadaceae bacterium]|nr:AarF/UbiB family protein [Pyrinomonadaceae bacterium]